jgi:4'-phosphopantetheinyl transferase
MDEMIRESWVLSLANEVHVWRVHLIARESSLARFYALLSEQERERAHRFRFEHLSQHFTIAHGALRALLGRYLSISPELIRFDEGRHGKPELSENTTTLRFNISHSSSLAALAFTAGRDVGVDIEAIRPVPEMADIARRYFSREEAIDLMHTAPDVRAQNFFRIWTRKEAFIKAIGDGLSFPLDCFAVSFRPEEEARLTHLRGDPGAARSWQLQGFEPAQGFAGALAYGGTRVHLRLFPSVDADELVHALSCHGLPDAS